MGETMPEQSERSPGQLEWTFKKGRKHGFQEVLELVEELENENCIPGDRLIDAAALKDEIKELIANG